VGRLVDLERASGTRPAAARAAASLTLGLLALGLLALGLLAACETPGGGVATGPVPRADAPAALAERLPASAAGFQRGATVPVTQPQQGTEVNYATEGRRAAAFVQVLRPAGAAPTADGPGDPEAQAEFQRWVAESARGQGPARRLSVASEFNEPPSSPLMRCAAMEGTYGRQPVQSLVCVGAAGGQILRIRASMPRHTPPVADPRAFVREVSAALRGGAVETGAPMPAASAPNVAAEAAQEPEAIAAIAPQIATRRAAARAQPSAPARAGAAQVRTPSRQAAQPARGSTPARTTAPARGTPQPARTAPRAGTTTQTPARR
jgi:hypothetical protein